jgi:hypothetical protein
MFFFNHFFILSFSPNSTTRPSKTVIIYLGLDKLLAVNELFSLKTPFFHEAIGMHIKKTEVIEDEVVEIKIDLPSSLMLPPRLSG